MPPETAVAIAIPDPAPTAALHAPILGRASALTVGSKAEHGDALGLIRDIRTLERQVEELFSDSKASASRTHRDICAAEKRLLVPLSAARAIINQKVSTYELEERRRADEERRRLEEHARKQEEERALLDAIAADEAGSHEEAEAILAAPVQAPVIHVEPRLAAVEGVIAQERWEAEVVDLGQLVDFVSSHKEWIHLLLPNMVALNGLARSQRQALAVQGVRAVSRTTRAVRSA